MQRLNATVIAATSDNEANVRDMTQKLDITFPVAHSVTDADTAPLDIWWNEDHRGYYMQPAEFLLLRGGTVFGSLYASGPVGRMDIQEVLTAIRSRENTRQRNST